MCTPPPQTYMLGLTVSPMGTIAVLIYGQGSLSRSVGVATGTAYYVSWAGGVVSVGVSQPITPSLLILSYPDPTPVLVKYAFFASGLTPVSYVVGLPPPPSPPPPRCFVCACRGARVSARH